MTENPAGQSAAPPRHRSLYVVVLTLIVLAGAYLRFADLGARSLWRDELCTWHVSRMDFWSSLRWGPELTIAPLYQSVLRAITSDSRASEFVLRSPAVFCGLLTILAGWGLGRLAGGWGVGIALAGLLAFNDLQIRYSQEARPYSMLVLGCTLSTVFWYQLLTQPRHRYFYAYIAAAVLSVYAHYLAALTVAAQALWWLAVTLRRPPERRSLRPLVALIVAGVLCVPLAVRYLRCGSPVPHALEWIGSPTWLGAQNVLKELTFGWQWVYGLLAPLALLWILSALGMRLPRMRRSGGAVFAGHDDICGPLFLWWLCAWFGLLVISWLAHPAVIARYALPAAVPALLLPLVIAFRLDRRAPIIIMVVFVAGAAPGWIGREYSPGVREMAEYINTNADPKEDTVVLVIDGATPRAWWDMERLPFLYYPLKEVPLMELPLNSEGRPEDNAALENPRTLYLVVFRSDPEQFLRGTGRRLAPIAVEGELYRQLLFTPYRLATVAPLAGE